MITFKEADWNSFCDALTGGTDQRKAIKWITERQVGTASACEHSRTREISTLQSGTKIFCVSCDEEILP